MNLQKKWLITCTPDELTMITCAVKYWNERQQNSSFSIEQRKEVEETINKAQYKWEL